MQEGMSASCAVDLLDGERRRLAVLGLGFRAVLSLAAYAESGAPGAVTVEHSFSSNYDVCLTGAALRPFLLERYPGRVPGDVLAAIADDRLYWVCGSDFS